MSFKFLFDKDILVLKGLKGFENSLVFDDEGSTSTKAVCIARNRKQMWNFRCGFVISKWSMGNRGRCFREYRNTGITAYLVKSLTQIVGTKYSSILFLLLPILVLRWWQADVVIYLHGLIRLELFLMKVTYIEILPML